MKCYELMFCLCSCFLIVVLPFIPCFFFVSFDLKDSLRRNLIYSPSGGFVSFHTDIACNCMLCLSKYKHHRRLVEQLEGADRGHLALDSQTRMQHLSIAKGEKRYDT